MALSYKQDCLINLKLRWYTLSTFLFTIVCTMSILKNKYTILYYTILSTFKTAELRDRLH